MIHTAKCLKVFCLVVGITACLAAFAAPGLHAQTEQSPAGMSLSGATGLFSIPSGRIGWDQSTKKILAIDAGYHSIMGDGGANSIPKVAVSLFNFIELNGAFDIRQENSRGNDFIAGAKVHIPLAKTALAVGANYQTFKLDGFSVRENAFGESVREYAWQFYAAATFAGTFFNMPAETTVVFGSTFINGSADSNIDFGMGFQLQLFPSVFENLLLWVTDFANFSYSANPYLADAWHRGILNTGLRVNLSAIPVFANFRFFADFMLVDGFDQNRAFSAGIVFGLPLL